MLIRKNTKPFKAILHIVEACQARPDRQKLVRLFLTKAGHTIEQRLPVEGIEGESELFYEMTYQAVLNNLRSSSHQLQESDEPPGIFFFHSSNKAWDETPFEFDEAIKKEFSSLPALPNVRKKEKAEKVALPTSKTGTGDKPVKTGSKRVTKEKPAKKQPAPDKPKQPAYKLKHGISFPNLDRIVFRRPQLTRKDVLDYYDQVAEHMLPYMKDRVIMITASSDGGRYKQYASLDALSENYEDLPDWLQAFQSSKDGARSLLCNDKEHLMFYASLGAVQFDIANSRTRSAAMPDYLVIAISSDAETSIVTEAVVTARTVLDGLKLPVFVKTGGGTSVQLYVPLDAKSKFAAASAVAGYLCRLIRLKSPDRMSLSGSDDYTYGKVVLDGQFNTATATTNAPYSLIAGDTANAATPITWDELGEGLRGEEFDPAAILKRLKREGDSFENLNRKKVNADEVLERLEEGYLFLL